MLQLRFQPVQHEGYSTTAIPMAATPARKMG
jgi:hypothetical protein